MSIFEAKEFWSTQISNNEEFDCNSIVIGNIDNENPFKQKIAVSSFSGFLRIFEPTFGEFKLEHRLFEKYFNEPILQIGFGNMIINNINEKQLVMLYRKKIEVVQFKSLRGITESTIKFKHNMVRSCYNFCMGKVGEKKYDILFVQSVDGVISIIEQDSIVNQIELYEMLIPGSITYVDRKDYFVISNPGYELECYTYNNIATAKGKGAKIIHNWVLNIGELVKELKVIYNLLTKKQEIFVLAETILFVINDNGVILYQKKLDFEAITSFIYNIEDTKYNLNKYINFMQMISTTNDHVLVYKGPNLAWALKVNDTPVYLNIIELEGIKGLICSLSDKGQLSIIYLGMEPIKNSKMILPTKNYDPDKIIEETEKLKAVISNFDKGIVTFPKDFLDMKVEVSSKILLDDNFSSDSIFLSDKNGRIKRMRVKFDLSFDGKAAENVKLHIITPYNIVCDEPVINIGLVTSDSNFTKIVNFRVISNFFPTNLTVRAHATYQIKGIFFTI